ncbi:MAG TPA: hypothetical protein VKA04_01675, partial [Pseudodesulfovibrio sp.]|nr:hypothetical protein [Pseudodesulfovibrio sp.]
MPLTWPWPDTSTGGGATVERVSPCPADSDGGGLTLAVISPGPAASWAGASGTGASWAGASETGCGGGATACRVAGSATGTGDVTTGAL